MLYEFLVENQAEILKTSKESFGRIKATHPPSIRLLNGLPIFYEQLIDVFRHLASNIKGDEALTKAAAVHGKELLHLGYTVSDVVHAYGSMCQAITGVATKLNVSMTSNEFHVLNRCLDVAIAGAVTEYQAVKDIQGSKREVEHLGSLVHELRNALTAVNLSLQMIRNGTVGFSGSTGRVLDSGLKRLEGLIDRSLTEVRLETSPTISPEPINLLRIIEQISVVAEVGAREKEQTLEIAVDSSLVVEADVQLFYSLLSNLIQNAIKYTRVGGKIQLRGNIIEEKALIEIEDECGGIRGNPDDLFKPFIQKNKNRDGLGLGLTIVQRAVTLNKGKLEVVNSPGKGCTFKVILPRIV